MHDLYYIDAIPEAEQLAIQLYSFLKHNNKLRHTIHVISDNMSPGPDYINMIEKIYPVVWSDRHVVKKALHAFQIQNKIHEHAVDVLPKKVAVVYHAHHPKQIKNTIKRLERLTKRLIVDVYLYHTLDDVTTFIPSHTCLNIKTIKIKNLGRDIRSFLKYIHEGLYTEYDSVLKIHTKNTTYLDSNWRDQYESYLIDCYTTCFGQMLSNNEHQHSVQKYKLTEPIANTNNSYSMSRLYDIFNINNNETQYTFYAGTMFWCDIVYCKLLKKFIDMQPTVTDLFEPEPLASDGTMAHAWERFLGQLPGYI